jgi:NAD(P)-dependent dehydrogenase (short-subunit alcohol dehydrogenase family)
VTDRSDDRALDAPSLFRLDGRIALVTGAGSGIGRACAVACAEAGADVACADVDEEAASEIASAVTALGRRALAIHVDVAVEDEVEGAFRQIDESLGPVDVVFANAGIAGAGGDIEEWTMTDWGAVIGVNLTGVFLTMRAAARRMGPRGYGKIVVTGSLYSVTGDRFFGAYGYAAAKGGVLSLVRTAAIHLAPKGIRVNAILPGYFRTQIGGGHMLSDDPEAVEFRQMLAERIPLGRLGEPEDMKGLAVFLASPASDYVTGAGIPIDGGWLA